MERLLDYLELSPLFQKAWGKDGSSVLERDNRLPKRKPQGYCLRDEKGEPVSGLISISRIGANDDTRHIAYIFTHPDERKNGLARQLLNDYTGLADEHSLIFTATIVKEDPSTTKLFTKAGFQLSSNPHIPDTHLWAERAPLALQPAHKAAHNFAGNCAPDR